MKNRKTFITKIEESEESEESEDSVESVDKAPGFIKMPEMRMLSLYGVVDEKIASEIVYSMFVYNNMKKITPLDNLDPPEKFLEEIEPLEFLISTPGGSASDMFSIYDTMKLVEKTMEIHTLGMGKVMSAGVLLLAAGTKGKRRIGRNCRVMIHAVNGGASGSSHEITNEIKEILFTEQAYIKSLIRETNLTATDIKNLLSNKINVYLTAKEAVKYGICDIIV